MNPLLAMTWRPDRAAWRALCAVAAVVVLFAAAGLALDVTWIPLWTAADVQADAPLEQAEPAIQAAPRCPHCGWIESKRQIASSAADPQSLGIYEYTLRMGDGSSSVFQETLPATWRVGERVGVIEGRGPPLN